MSDEITSGWPIAVAIIIIVIFFIVMFKKEISTLMGRIKSIDRNGLRTFPNPDVQRNEPRSSAAQELLMAIGSTVVLNEQESNIIQDLQSRGLKTSGDTIDVLIKHLAATQLALAFEQTHNLMLGSQIQLLKQLNEVIGQGQDSDFMERYFQDTKETHKPVFDAWDLDVYLDFLKTSNLITQTNNRYHITNLGVEYLSWMVRAGKSENSPL